MTKHDLSSDPLTDYTPVRQSITTTRGRFFKRACTWTTMLISILVLLSGVFNIYSHSNLSNLIRTIFVFSCIIPWMAIHLIPSYTTTIAFFSNDEFRMITMFYMVGCAIWTGFTSNNHFLSTEPDALHFISIVFWIISQIVSSCVAYTYAPTAEQNLHLIQELDAKTRRIGELGMIITELQAALDRPKDETEQKSKGMQLDRDLEESNEYRRKLDLNAGDNRCLQDDLLTVTRGNQTIHQELQHATDDEENLKLQIQECTKEVSKCENVIAQKENDRTTLFDQHHEATNELSHAKLTLADIESLTVNLRQELQMKSSDMKRLTERMDYLERELQQHKSVRQEYEIQFSSMNRSAQRNEELIKKLHLDKQTYANEITNIRDLNSTVETKKEHILRQSTAKEIENEQLQSAISDPKIEIDMLRTQINNEKAMVHNLEDIIGSSREKEVQSQLHVQEKDSELQLARDRANMNELKVQSQGKEIAALRAKLIELETDNDRLKRQLTSERFEREKAAQDLRKLSDLTSHIDYETRYRSTSPRLTSTTHHHRSPTRRYSPSRTELSQSSPTKEVDRSCSLCADTTP